MDDKKGEELVEKTLQIPTELMDQINEKLKGSQVSFSEFVEQAVLHTLEKRKEKKNN